MSESAILDANCYVRPSHPLQRESKQVYIDLPIPLVECLDSIRSLIYQRGDRSVRGCSKHHLDMERVSKMLSLLWGLLDGVVAFHNTVLGPTAIVYGRIDSDRGKSDIAHQSRHT